MVHPAMAARPALPFLLLLPLFLILISAVDLVSSDIAPSPVPGGPVRAPIPPTPLPASPIPPTPLPASAVVPSPLSPAPALGPSPSSQAPASDPSAPSPTFSPGNSESPPAPPVASASSPLPTLSPAPTPATYAVNEQAVASGGMSRGKKAGIAVLVLSAATIVGVGALVCKKRRENIQRSRYGYATRRDML